MGFSLNIIVGFILFLVEVLRAIKRISIIFRDKTVGCDALFDTGASVTIISTRFFASNFAPEWKKLEKPLRVFWINGESIIVDKYVQVFLKMDDQVFPETVFLVDDFVEEIEVNGKKIRMPQVIIGAGTMDKYGIVIEPKKGVKVTPMLLI